MQTSIPTRALRLEGATNFRDLGGYRAADGRTVRWRLLFRSNHLGHLSGADLERIAELKLRRIVDFRHPQELGKVPPCPIPGVERLPLPIDPTIRARLDLKAAAGETLDAALTARLMCELYREYVHVHAGRFRALFGQLLDDPAPLVFHCSAGKDRTGFAAALLLSALGVPREAVMADYLLTNELWRIDPATTAGLPEDAARVLGSAQAPFLAAALDAIDSDFGGVEGYLSRSLGLREPELERLGELYLQAT